jgi:membrane protein YqaA with SNARE-associated domain
MSSTYQSPLSRIAIAAAVCLAVGAAWYVLFQAHIVSPSPPDGGDNAAYFAWWRPIEWQTISIYLLVSAGFAGIAVLGNLLGGFSGAALAVGGGLAAVAQLAQMGGQHAVLRASETAIDPRVLGTIGFITDSISQGLFVGAYVVLGLGAVGVTLQTVPVVGDVLGRVAGVLLGIALVLMGILSLTDPFNLLDPVTALVGVVIAPVWLWRLAASSPGPTVAMDSLSTPSVQRGGSVS